MRRVALCAALSLALVPLGCGEDDGDGGAQKKTRAKATKLKLESPGGALRYRPASLEAPAGPVTFEFVNRSTTPHNLIVQAGTKVDTRKKAVGGTPVIYEATGEAVARKTFDLKAGPYVFYCSVQNHEALGMKGTLTVR